MRARVTRMLGDRALPVSLGPLRAIHRILACGSEIERFGIGDSAGDRWLQHGERLGDLTRM